VVDRGAGLVAHELGALADLFERARRSVLEDGHRGEMGLEGALSVDDVERVAKSLVVEGLFEHVAHHLEKPALFDRSNGRGAGRVVETAHLPEKLAFAQVADGRSVVGARDVGGGIDGNRLALAFRAVEPVL
jgi:hypothetical protein